MIEQLPDLNLRYVQAELARIDVLLAHEIRRWQRAGQDPTDVFRGLYVSDAEAQGLLARPLGVSWGQTIVLDPAEGGALAQALKRAEAERDQLAQIAAQHGWSLSLADLKQAFGLDALDFDAFLICLAPFLDARYERLYGYLQDDVTRKRPTVNLILNLLCDAGIGRLSALSRFAHQGPLIRFQLLEMIPEPTSAGASILNQALAPDPAVVTWLLGDYEPAVDWREYVVRHMPSGDQPDALLPERIKADLERAKIDLPLLVFHGPDRLAQQWGAQWLAAEMKRALLQVDAGSVVKSGAPPDQVVRLILRDAAR